LQYIGFQAFIGVFLGVFGLFWAKLPLGLDRLLPYGNQYFNPKKEVFLGI